MKWPFKRKSPADAVTALGALVQAGGHEIASELADLNQKSEEASRRLGRIENSVAGFRTDNQELTRLVSSIHDEQVIQRKMLEKLIAVIPEESRPTPIPPPPRLPTFYRGPHVAKR